MTKPTLRQRLALIFRSWLRPPCPPRAVPIVPIPQHVILTLPMNAATTLEQCGALLERVPGWRLDFYAADQPSPTDPGAYISVIRNVTDDSGYTTLLRKRANHGWSSHWIRTERAEIQAELYRNRAHQPHASVRLTLADYTYPDNTR